MAEEEARAINARTCAALVSANARGMKLGNLRLRAGDGEVAAVATAAWQRDAAQRSADVLPYVTAARRAGATLLRQIAAT